MSSSWGRIPIIVNDESCIISCIVEGDWKTTFKQAQNAEFFRTAPFSLHGNNWELNIYPNGNATDTIGHVGVFLKRISSNSQTECDKLGVNYTVSTTEPRTTYQGNSIFTQTSSSWGFAKVVNRQEIDKIIKEFTIKVSIDGIAAINADCMEWTIYEPLLHKFRTAQKQSSFSSACMSMEAIGPARFLCYPNGSDGKTEIYFGPLKPCPSHSAKFAVSDRQILEYSIICEQLKYENTSCVAIDDATKHFKVPHVFQCKEFEELHQLTIKFVIDHVMKIKLTKTVTWDFWPPKDMTKRLESKSFSVGYQRWKMRCGENYIDLILDEPSWPRHLMVYAKIQFCDGSNLQSISKECLRVNYDGDDTLLLRCNHNETQPNLQAITSPSCVRCNIQVGLNATMEKIFRHHPVKVWEECYNGEVKERGEGTIVMYADRKKGLGEIMFTDEKHETRLLQYINGITHCEYNTATFDEVADEKVQWVGSDYAINPHNPVAAKWNIHFMHDAATAKEFRRKFNDLIDAHDDDDDDDDDDTKSVSSANALCFSFDRFRLKDMDNKEKPFVNDPDTEPNTFPDWTNHAFSTKHTHVPNDDVLQPKKKQYMINRVIKMEEIVLQSASDDNFEFEEYMHLLNENQQRVNVWSHATKGLRASVQQIDTLGTINDHNDIDLEDEKHGTDQSIAYNDLYKTFISRAELMAIQSKRMNQIINGGHIPKLMAIQPQIIKQMESIQTRSNSEKQQNELLNQKYQEMDQKRLMLESTMEKAAKECNEVVMDMNKIASGIKQKTQHIQSLVSQYQKFKSASQTALSLINAYNSFESDNEAYIKHINSYFNAKWKRFESTWWKWSCIDVISWFKYAMRERDTSTIDWMKVGKEMAKRNMNGESLEKVSEFTLDSIGIHDFKIAVFLMKQVATLRNRYSKKGDGDDPCSNNDKQNTIPPKFICPLTKQIMKNPVMAFDGNTYEHEAIEKYFKQHGKSPITNEKAYTLNVYSHRQLKKEIQSYCSLNNIKGNEERAAQEQDVCDSDTLYVD
eukprot:329911_1